MYIDKMIEYLVLSDIVTKWSKKRKKKKLYNMDKIIERMKEIRNELLEPYAINSDSKE